jgi:hypothetical protein
MLPIKCSPHLLYTLFTFSEEKKEKKFYRQASAFFSVVILGFKADAAAAMAFRVAILFCLTAAAVRIVKDDAAVAAAPPPVESSTADDDADPSRFAAEDGAVVASGDDAAPVVCFMCSHSMRSRFHKARRITSRNWDQRIKESFDGWCQKRNVQLNRNKTSASKITTETATPYRSRFRSKLYQHDDVAAG